MMGGDRNDPASVRRRIEALEAVLERAFIVPGINRPIRLDAIVGLIPVVGDLLAALMSAYVIWEARNLGMSKWHLARLGDRKGARLNSSHYCASRMPASP